MTAVFLSPPHMGAEERSLLAQAFDSNWIAPLGPHVEGFEREMAERVGVAHAVALSSGTAALHLSLILAGVSRGDEVWTSTLTFAATANPIVYLGANPVFFDVHPESWNIDVGAVEEELARAFKRNALPKAIIAVDLYGQCADYAPLRALCRQYDVTLIEDAAEALGATYQDRPAGTLGDMGVFSFNGNKIITTSGGGMLVCESREWADRARHLATQARDPAPHYQHSQIGFNYRMSNLLAAVGRGQLRALDDRLQARRRINAFYRRAFEDLPGVTFQPEAAYGRSNCWLTCLQIDPEAFGATREDVRAALQSIQIESRPLWKPLHLQPVFTDCRMVRGAYAEGLFDRGLCLPSGSALSGADLERVAVKVRECRR